MIDDSEMGLNYSVQSGLWRVFPIVRGRDRGHMALFGSEWGVFWVFPFIEV